MKKKRTGLKILLVLILLLLVAAGIFIGTRYYVFGEGVKTGQLNYVVKKGIVFKTYEGKLIQTGFRSQATGSMGSNEFEFSVADKEVAEKLMKVGGREVELYYKEYFGAIPWRGFSKYVVDSIVNIREATNTTNAPTYLENQTH